MWLKQSYYDQGEKPGKLLAWRIKKIQTDRAINSLALENGVNIVDPLEINNTFKLYFENLYESEFTNDLEKQDNFLDKLKFPEVSEGTRSELERNLSLKELSEALQSMSSGKAPGPDGLPTKIYKTFAGKLLPHLLEMFNEAFEKGILPPSLRSALITLILKG